MNKEEIKTDNDYEQVKNTCECCKFLKQELDQSNNKIEKIKEYMRKVDTYDWELYARDYILSIIDEENK